MKGAFGLLALAAALQPVASAAEVEGRLFFRADERILLDEARRRPDRLPPPPPDPGTAPASAPPPPPVTLNGVVRRSDGSSTVWLNNRPVASRQSTEGIEILPPGPSNPSGRVTVRVPESGRKIDMAVGQQLNVTTGEIRERFRLPTQSAVAPDDAAESAKPEPTRRPGRSRELLRDLLRELDPATVSRGADEPAPASTER